jgi:hypothetical protein
MSVASFPQLTWVWFGTLWAVGGIGTLYFWFGSNAEDKRQLYPWFMGLTLFLVLCFAYFVVQPPLPFLGLFALVGVASAVVHVRITKFCPRCARMIYRGMLAGRVDYCPRCGLALDRPQTQALP